MSRFAAGDQAFHLGRGVVHVEEVLGFSDNGQGYGERLYRVSRMVDGRPDSFNAWSSHLHRSVHAGVHCPDAQCCRIETQQGEYDNPVWKEQHP